MKLLDDWRGAVLSPCGRYRYRLWRRYGDGPLACFVMLNPSTADATADDPTIRRCIRFAATWGYAGIDVVNLAALRCTDPTRLRNTAETIGAENDHHIAAAACRAGVVVAAWGAGAGAVALRGRAAEVLYLLRRVEVRCLGMTARRWPRHPLYVPARTPLVVYMEAAR